MVENKVTFVIPARNEEKYISACLNSIFNQTFKKFDIIVINDGSTDDTPKILSEFKNVTVITENGIGPGQARNRGWIKTNSEFIAFCDADITLDTRWLDYLLPSFDNPNVGAVGGKELSPKDDSWFGKRVFDLFCFLSFGFEYNNNTIAAVSHLPTSNLIYRRAVLEKTKGFNTFLWTGEDVDLSIRTRESDYIIIQNPQALAFGYKPQTFSEFIKMMRIYGSAQRKLMAMHGIKRKIQLAPFIYLLFLVLETSLWIRFGFILPLIILGVGIALCWLFLLLRTGFNFLQSIFLLILLILGINFWNYGFFRPTLTPSHRKI